MTAGQWKAGRERAGFTQAMAAHSLKVSQPYLSQLETGQRLAAPDLARKAAKLYDLPAALPLPEPLDLGKVRPTSCNETSHGSVTPVSRMSPLRRAILLP
jgi:hypothetical protein